MAVLRLDHFDVPPFHVLRRTGQTKNAAGSIFPAPKESQHCLHRDLADRAVVFGYFVPLNWQAANGYATSREPTGRNDVPNFTIRFIEKKSLCTLNVSATQNRDRGPSCPKTTMTL